MKPVHFVAALTLILVATDCVSGADKTVELMNERRDLGEKLIRTLDNTKLDVSTRAAAAKALGELRYAPAIPKLLEHWTTLVLPGPFFDSEIDDSQGYPCLQALHKYGPEAIEPIVDRYLNEDEEYYRDLLKQAFFRDNLGRSRAVAIRYVRGLGYELDHRKKLNRLIKLYTSLQDLSIGDDPKIPKEWLKNKD